MVDSDSAFLWETEALRTSSRVGYPPAGTRSHDEHVVDWVTLRQASQATGIPSDTIRKWARKDHVTSYTAESAAGLRKMVSLNEVYTRAAKLGRQVDITEIDLSDPEPGQFRSLEPEPTPEPELQPGTMLVPIDAWDKMLMQLGNLHEAGQQLAEARERAAKAETESRFLKERLGELRAELADLESASNQQPAWGESHDAADSQALDAGADERVVEGSDSPEDVLTIRAYSLEMLKHLYSTWRQRPKR